MAKSCRVVTIARSLGAGGEEVGRAVAKELGFRYANEEIIVRAAEAAGVSPEAMAQAEATPGLITRILESMARAPVVPEAWTGYPAMDVHEAQRYESLIEAVIRQTGAQGDVVIVAHGASFPLAGTDGLLRVFVTAPPDVRAKRLAQRSNLSEQEAHKAVRDSDGQRREFLRRFYEVKDELPTHYDLVLNTDVLSAQQAVRLVVTAAKG
ncbi:MAG TPA: cytidylate kinase-like family protein [Dehalococcoidia bacterium]|nr:cytidylate kinase-like family protein [Dehalococcoidia bacterium]